MFKNLGFKGFVKEFTPTKYKFPVVAIGEEVVRELLVTSSEVNRRDVVIEDEVTGLVVST